ncbi:hypothetical protein [Methanolobus sp. WCC4]|uniref:hypothetical protein n=1 Tax=Methanolobus sp. WCC4 TaxID=3125784 RepID=UPI0030F936B6
MISGKIYGVSLKVLIILFSLIVVAAPAVAVAPPIVLGGNLLVDGNPAPVGTEVTIVDDGQTVATTTVTTAGLYGDERSNRLGVSSDHSVVTVEVNGVETATLDLSDYQTGEMVSLDLSATSPPPTATEETRSTSSGGGGGGGFGSASTTESAVEEEAESSGSSAIEETILESPVEEEEDIAEEGSSPVNGASSTLAIFGLILVGVVVVSYKYGFKK